MQIYLASLAFGFSPSDWLHRPFWLDELDTWLLAMIMFSYLIQPVMRPRYSMPAVLFLAPVIALLLFRVRPWLLAVAAIGFFTIGIHNSAASVRGRVNPEWQGVATWLRAQSVLDGPIVIPGRHLAYPIWRDSGDSFDQVQVAFPEREEPGRFQRYEEAITERMAELFPVPRRLRPEELDDLDRFVLVEPRALPFAEGLTGFAGRLVYEDEALSVLQMDRVSALPAIAGQTRAEGDRP